VNGDITVVTKARLGAAKKCYFSFEKHLGSKLSSQKIKYLIHKIGLKFEEETSEMLHLEHGFVWC
jgi:hypothetical protein